VAAGFEWFVAWRYLRARGRTPSPVPLLVGLAFLAAAGGLFALAAHEPIRPILRFGVVAEFRRLFIEIGVVLAAVALFGVVLGGQALARSFVPDTLTRPTPAQRWRIGAVLFAGLVIVVAGVGLVLVARYDLTPQPGTWAEAEARTAELAGKIGVGVLIASGLSTLVGLMWWFEAGEARAAAAMRAWLGGAFVLVIAGGAIVLVGARPESLGRLAGQLTVHDFRQVHSMTGVACVVLGGLITVFSSFFLLQSIFTTISTFGVFLGTWALCIALSVMNGFEVDLRQKILGSNAHVLISKDDGAFTEWREVEARLDDIPGIVAHTPYVSSEVVIAVNSNSAGVVIKGIDPRSVGKVTDLERNLQKGSKLANLWPLADDGGPIEYRSGGDAGPIPSVDLNDAGQNEPNDAGVDLAPPDFSGGLEGEGGAERGGEAGEPGDASEAGDAGAVGDEGPDRAPRDFSGGGADPTGADRLVAGGAELHDGDEAGDDEAGDDEPGDEATGAGTDAGPRGKFGGLFGRDRFLAHDDSLLDLAVGAPTVIGPRGPRDALERPLDPRIAALDGLFVGRELAKNLHLYIGQEVQVVSPLGQDTPSGQVPRVRSFRVAGIFYSGMYEYDTKFAYVSLPALQSFLSLGDEVTGIEIKVNDHDRTEPALRALGERLGPTYKVQDWKEINRSLFSALKLEKIAMFLVLTIIILVASFSIISNLIMVVVEKGREIAILKAQGASDGGVMRTFMIEGLYIGIMGTFVGVILGFVSCWALDRFGLPLDPDVYYIDRLPVATDPIAYVLVTVAGIAISFVATIYPSYLAARMRPVDGLRYE
jgi:lipoprotein-releasing system permease protein